MLAFVRGEPACFSRATFVPGHFTGSAFIACPAIGKVLLHFHRRLGKWLQMGGHDEGERDLYRTALREGAEESGLQDLAPLGAGLLDVSVHPIPAGKGEPDHLHLDARWAFATASPEAVVLDPDESVHLEWLDLAEAAARMAEPASARALAKLARLF
jgi:8-oxo-dGTP pyrophosphatase MutT (NUDIX family)